MAMKIFSESFTLEEIDPDGKAFDEVSRGVFVFDDCTMLMDYHTGIFPYKKMDKMKISIFSDENNFSEKDIPEEYSYLMGNGILYKSQMKENKQILDISFSGLLVSLQIEAGRIKDIEKCRRLYLGVASAKEI